MKLLILIHSMSSGGAERVTANLANHWAEQGWDISIVTLTTDSEDFYALLPAINRISLNLAIDSKNVVSSIINNIKRILAVRKILKSIKPKIALGMMTSANVYLALAGYGLHDIRIIGSEHTHPPQMPLGRMWEFLRKHTYKYLDHLAVLTSETQDWIRKSTNAKQVTVIPNAIPYPLTTQEPIFNPSNYLDNNNFYLIAVGRFGEEKRFDLLIKAFSSISRQYHNLNLIILGEGQLRQSLQAQIKDLQLESRVLMPGRVGNVGDWYAAADIYIMTSRFEGFPNTLVEAMAYGLPAISFDCDTGPRDIIRHGVDGLLVPPNNIPELVLAIEKLIDDESLRKEMAEKAIEVRERFSMEKITQQWERIIK